MRIAVLLALELWPCKFSGLYRTFSSAELVVSSPSPGTSPTSMGGLSWPFWLVMVVDATGVLLNVGHGDYDPFYLICLRSSLRTSSSPEPSVVSGLLSLRLMLSSRFHGCIPGGKLSGIIIGGYVLVVDLFFVVSFSVGVLSLDGPPLAWFVFRGG